MHPEDTDRHLATEGIAQKLLLGVGCDDSEDESILAVCATVRHHAHGSLQVDLAQHNEGMQVGRGPTNVDVVGDNQVRVRQHASVCCERHGQLNGGLILKLKQWRLAVAKVKNVARTRIFITQSVTTSTPEVFCVGVLPRY